MRKLVVLFALAGLLTGCGGPTEGTIVTMKHEDARYYEEYDYCKTQYPVTRTRQVYDSYNKTYRTEVYTDYECQGGYVTRYDDEDWMIEIEKCEQPKTENTAEAHNDGGSASSSSKPKCERAWRAVDSETYKLAKVGMYYDGKTVIASGGTS